MSKKVGKLASRYAKALFNAAVSELGESGTPSPQQKLAGQLLEFSAVWERDKELTNCILSPMFKDTERLSALVEVSRAAGLPPLAQRFLQVLFERDRIAALPEICAAFSGEADKRAGAMKVEIVTARAVSSEESEEIQKGLATHIGGRPVFTWRVDPTVIGGMIVSFGGKVLDGSLSGQLSRIERSLVS